MLPGATLHTIGILTPPRDPALLALENSMQSFRFGAGMGMNPSILDVHMLLVLAVTFSGFGILNLTLAGPHDISERLLRRVIRIKFAGRKLG
jgi:hypothetical protein